MNYLDYLPFKLLKSPSSNTNQSKNSRLSFNFFYFATGDTQKDSGLEIEFLLDTGASSSIINYRTFWEICQMQHPISVTRSTIQTKTYSGPTCTYDWFSNVNIKLRPGWTIFLPLNRLDYRNENSKPSRHGLLSKAGIRHPF